MVVFGSSTSTTPRFAASKRSPAYDDAIRQVAAVTGATGAAFDRLNAKAKQLGASTSFTAVEVANLMTELGRAGFKPEQIEAMTASVMNLARATGTDAAVIVAGSISLSKIAAPRRRSGFQFGKRNRHPHRNHITRSAISLRTPPTEWHQFQTEERFFGVRCAAKLSLSTI
jgi:hypothetical protein